MKPLILAAAFSLFYLSGQCQPDTVVIKNIKFYQPGKVNMLKSPSGKKSIVRLESLSRWKENEKIDSAFYWDTVRRVLKPGVDTSLPAPFPMAVLLLSHYVFPEDFDWFKSYVDPGLTKQQKENIKANECVNAKFAGLSRGKVKVSFVSGNAQTYSTLTQFINTLPADVDMEGVIDELDKPWKERAIQEQKSVTLKNVYLKAYKREADNDYHLIICNKSETVFFNAEISGLPGTSVSSYNTLKNVRNVFNNFPGSANCGGSYIKFDEPLKILSLKGALFFDTDHAAGQVGPQGFRPRTAWEIHPVTTIVFE